MAKLRPLGTAPLGDLAAYVEFSRTLDLEVNEMVQRLAVAVQRRGVPWVRDVVPALGGLALHFHESFQGNPLQFAAELVNECIKHGLPAAKEFERMISVPVCYDPELAPDLAEVAQLLKISAEEVVQRHIAAEYRVLMIGFAPGHAYMGSPDAKLPVPRRATPRTQVPGGSVAIANDQTVVYPYAIAGGWSVIGRTPLVVFDAARVRPSLFEPGDRVRFRPIPRQEFDRMAEPL
ncbi:MAG TPA: 5-oxoprolinase subunit PxpB [Burkholderiales bacterium]|nr:5-oxoprolinase subunit PxpB [Burkholderiales bacterium]